MPYASSAFNEKPEIDPQVGMQVYLHEGGVWVQGHWHDAIEVVFALFGIVSLEVNHEVYHLNEGESMIIKPGEVHSFIAAPKSVRLVVQFMPKTLFKSIYQEKSMVELENHLEDLDLQTKNWPKKLRHAFHENMLEIQEAFGTYDDLREIRLLNKASKFVLQLYDEKIPLNTKKSKRKSLQRLDKLKEIYDYIEAHYQSDVTLDDIAKEVGYNKHYLTRFFKAMTGQSVMHFVNDYRLNQAKWLLITTDGAMDEVAFESGFQSTKRFHHVFKETMHTSPLQYRKEMQKKKETQTDD